MKKLSKKELIIAISTFTVAIIALTIGVTWMVVEDNNNVNKLETFELEIPSKSELEIFLDEFIEQEIENQDDIIEEKEQGTSIWNNL